MSRLTPLALRMRLAAVATAAVTLAACAPGDDAPSANENRPDLTEFVGLLSGGTAAGYDPAESPRELAERSDLVIEGRLERVQPGRVWGFDDGSPPLHTVVLVLDVDHVHRGALPPGARDRVYVELISGGGVKAEAYDKALPRGAAAVAYLIKDWKERPGNPPLRDPGSGRPTGQPLWDLTTPQGLFIEDSAHRVLQGREEAVYEGTDLSSFLPHGEQWPTHAGPPSEGEPHVHGS